MANAKYTVRDGFQVCQEVFFLPSNPSELDFQTQQTLNICNLFVNEKFSISDIIRLADEDYRTIVQTLLKQQVILDRRKGGSEPFKRKDRRQAESV
jgi:hypothetical protein